MLHLGIGLGKVASVTFDPTTFGTMLCGFDTFDPTRLLNPSAVAAANGDDLDQLTDVSGNARHIRQTNGAKRPTLVTNVLNGYPAINFDGVSQFFEMPGCTTITQNKPGLASCFVHEQVDTLSNYGLFEFEDGSFAHRIRAFTTPQLSVEGHRADADGNDQLFSGAGNLYTAGVFYITVIVWGTVAGTLGGWSNSNTASLIKSDGTGATAFSTTGATTSNTASGETPVIGAANLYNSQLFKGRLVVGYFYEFTGFNRTGLMSALGTKLGITIS